MAPPHGCWLQAPITELLERPYNMAAGFPRTVWEREQAGSGPAFTPPVSKVAFTLFHWLEVSHWSSPQARRQDSASGMEEYPTMDIFKPTDPPQTCLKHTGDLQARWGGNSPHKWKSCTNQGLGNQNWGQTLHHSDSLSLFHLCLLLNFLHVDLIFPPKAEIYEHFHRVGKVSLARSLTTPQGKYSSFVPASEPQPQRQILNGHAGSVRTAQKMPRRWLVWLHSMPDL